MFEYALKKKAKRRRLKNIEVEEISLVDAAANQKTFSIIKRDGAADPEGILELLKDFAGQEVTAEDLELAETPDKALAIIKDAIKKLTPYVTDDLFPDDVAAAIRLLGKFAGIGYGYSPAPGDGDGQSGDDQAKAEGVDEHFETRRARLKKNAEAFPSLNPLLASLPAFARRVRKRAAAEDQADDGDQGDDADGGSALEKLQRVNEKLAAENRRLSRRSAQVKDDETDVDIEKGKDVPQWPSVIIPGFFQ